MSAGARSWPICKLNANSNSSVACASGWCRSHVLRGNAPPDALRRVFLRNHTTMTGISIQFGTLHDVFGQAATHGGFTFVPASVELHFGCKDGEPSYEESEDEDG